MKPLYTRSSIVSTKVVAGLFVASQISAFAEEVKNPDLTFDSVDELEPTTVIASKFKKELKDVPASVAVLDPAELINEGNSSVVDAIGYRTPGVIATSTAGQSGYPGSLFIRGTKTNRSQMRLDGVRIYDPSGSGGINNFLGSASLYGFSSIEILKGASSSLYGAGSIGGVLAFNTAKGEGDPTYTAKAEYGSYESWLGVLSSQGQVGDFSYNVGVVGQSTQNDSDSVIDGSDSDQFSYYGRFDYAIDNHSSVGLTLRGGDSDYETPEYGDVPTNKPQQNSYDYLFGSVFYENQINEAWKTRVTFGFSKEDYDDTVAHEVIGYPPPFYAPTPTGEFADSTGSTNSDRISTYWDNEYQWSEKQQTVFGAYYENVQYKSHYQGPGYVSSTKDNADTYGVYLNHSWQVMDSVILNGGLGWDDHDDFGNEWVWSAGLLYQATSTTTLRSNIGKGYRAPSFAELTPNPGYPAYGIPATVVDSSLGAEQSLNWDIGIEQEIYNTTVTLTWFENDIENSIDTDTSGDPYVRQNVSGKTKANGLEFSSNTTIDQINSTLFTSYTYYQHSEVTEIPQQSASAGLDSAITDSINAGLVCTWVDERESAGSELESYFLLNLYANYQLNENVKLHARIDNLLDDDYLLGDYTFYGDPNAIKGRGRGVYGGVTLTF
ncbi:TonB-dependent receptor plug domain-containing protein [Rubritalea sp.]|uniref:TonB-dependent receptor plug domain-containing protein n=1 Tax=Rubritalea sp. TaxID=2109375 RepID=UPI003EF93BE3